jgi:SAM-dependent methyltransferase
VPLLDSRLGRCNVCGKASVFWRWHASEIRNDLKCVRCGSIARKRHVAKFVIGKLAPGARSLRELVRTRRPSVYAADVGDALHRLFGAEPGWRFSAHDEAVERGQPIGPNATCQDLERLTFADASFDAVLTEDVMEHVRDDARAFAEIRRVLKPGGWHVFTTPVHLFSRTILRVRVEGDRDVEVLPAEYHGDPRRGRALVYRLYGYDLVERLAELGFATELHPTYDEDRKIGVFESFVFASRRTS